MKVYPKFLKQIQQTRSMGLCGRLLSGFCLLLIVSCGTPKELLDLEADVALNTAPQIIFLSYEIKKNKADGISAMLVNKIMAEGKLKKEFDEEPYSDGDFELIQLDANGKPLLSKRIKNPLTEILEYVNDEGEFGKKEVSFDSKEISIRWQLHSKTKSIKLQEIGNESINFVETKL